MFFLGEVKLPELLSQLNSKGSFFEVDVSGIEKYESRESYYCSFVVDRGKLRTSQTARAHGRDLFQVLTAIGNYQEKFVLKRLKFTVTNNLILKIEILSETSIDFFTEEDFEYLSKYAGIKKDSKNEEHSNTYYQLRILYQKVKFWAEKTCEQLFGSGKVDILMKPTSRASNFGTYQWVKIYPSKEMAKAKILAYTLGVSQNGLFELKIDTVGLDERDVRRRKYEDIRGNFNNSAIVKFLRKEDVVSTNWDNLIELSVGYLRSLADEYNRIYKVLTNEENESFPNVLPNNYDLNTILYGPPGTGKTYSSVCYAVAIIEGKVLSEIEIENRLEVKKRFDKYVEQRKVWFTTFHQSTAYEDFVEGIKPVERKDSLSYEVVPGIFRQLCDEAAIKRNRTVLIDNVETELTKEVFEDFYNEFTSLLPDQKEITSDFNLRTKENYPFSLHKNGAGSIVVRAGEKKAALAIPMNELVKVLFEGKIPTYKPYEQKILDAILSEKGFKENNEDHSSQRYVLIIDEINRGNIAQIFGELITLIENGKRKGQTECIEVILPYSKKKFCVPVNIYIVATMNTADRSVEALDTALRRRFSFKEIEPKPYLLAATHRYWDLLWEYEKVEWENKEFVKKEQAFFELWGVSEDFINERKEMWIKMREEKKSYEQIEYLEGHVFSGLDLSLILTVINKRLERLLSKDHLIGHSFFINVTSLRDVKDAFQFKISPLLQEYFYGDYGKIGLVLGKGFIVKIEEDVDELFVETGDYNLSQLDKPIYRLKDVSIMSDFDFKLALRDLLGSKYMSNGE